MAFNIKENDTGPNLALILREAPVAPATVGDPVDLTGGALEFHMRGPLPATTLKIAAGVGTIVGAPTDGRADYDWAGAGDTDTPGEYEYEMQFTDAAAKVFTFPNTNNGRVIVHPEIS